jgi:hypothetical protein
MKGLVMACFGIEVCTSVTRPSAPLPGELIYETDTKLSWWYNGTAWRPNVESGTWTTYNPTLTAVTTSPNLGSTGIGEAKYTLIGNTALLQGRFLFGGSGVSAGSGKYSFNLPIAAANQITNGATGNGFVHHASNFFEHCTIPVISSSSSCVLYAIVGSTGIGSDVTNNYPWVWAAGDQIQFNIQYEI